MWNQILDLPVIIQSALGGFLFWLVFEILKRIINFSLNKVSKFNKKMKEELLMYEALHHGHNAFESGSGSEISMHVASIFAALNRFIQAIIYICIGIIASNFLGDISIVAYIIAIYYLFFALRAVRIDFVGSNMSTEEHLKEFRTLVKKINTRNVK